MERKVGGGVGSRLHPSDSNSSPLDFVCCCCFPFFHIASQFFSKMGTSIARLCKGILQK